MRCLCVRVCTMEMERDCGGSMSQRRDDEMMSRQSGIHRCDHLHVAFRCCVRSRRVVRALSAKRPPNSDSVAASACVGVTGHGAVRRDACRCQLSPMCVSSHQDQCRIVSASAAAAVEVGRAVGQPRRRLLHTTGRSCVQSNQHAVRERSGVAHTPVHPWRPGTPT